MVAFLGFQYLTREESHEGPADVDPGGVHGNLESDRRVPAGAEPTAIEFDRSGPAREAAALASETPLRILCASGHPVEQATATWTPMNPAFFGPWVGWESQAWARIATDTLRTQIEDGIVRAPLEWAAKGDHPWAIWITSPEHVPELVLCSDPGDLPTALVLEHVAPMRVQVVAPDGSPMPDALIEQFADIPRGAPADVWSPQAARLLHRAFRTDDAGWAEVAGWRGRMVLRARTEGSRSTPWIGEARSELVLVLHETFQLLGDVTYPQGALEGLQRVVVSALRGAQAQVVSVADVDSGRYGPLELPCLDGDGFSVRLEGWNAEVRERRLASQSPGARVRVDFEAVPGLDVWAIAETVEGEPVLESAITIGWEQDGAHVETTGHSMEDGHVLIRGVPPCTAIFRGRAEGLATEPRGPVVVPMDPPVTYVVRMFAGREIRGTVKRAGQAVEDFEIVSWDWDSNYHVVESFRGREDGSFTIRARAGPTTTIVGSSVGCGPSLPVQVPPERTAPIQLELGGLVRGHGRVTDASTGDGIPTATVQAFVTAELGPVSPLSSPHSVDGDGEFEHDFPTGRSRVRFQAPGYAAHWQDVQGVPGEILNLGTIALGRRRDIDVRLVSEEPVEAQAYSLHGFGVDPIPHRFFDEDGHTLIEGLSPGSYLLHLGGPRLARVWVEVSSDENDDLEIPIGEGHTLVVTADLHEQVEGELWVRVTTSSRSGPAVEFLSPLDQHGRAEFPGLPTGSFIAYLTRDWGPPLASASGRFEGDEELQEITLTPDSEAWTLVVTLPDGTPASGATIRTLDTATHTSASCTLDEMGRGTVRGLDPTRTYTAFVRHPELGFDPEVPLDLPTTSQQAIEIEFDPTSSIELVLLDHTFPIGGARCTLADPRGAWPALSTSTSEASSGRVAWTHLGPGEYSVAIDHPELWPRELTVTASAPGSATPVQVRRLGDLRIEVRSADSHPLSNRQVDVISLEFGTSAADWLAAGRIECSSVSLGTDSQGVLTLGGLPAGSYQLTTGQAQRIANVLPGTLNRVTVFVP